MPKTPASKGKPPKTPKAPKARSTIKRKSAAPVENAMAVSQPAPAGMASQSPAIVGLRNRLSLGDPTPSPRLSKARKAEYNAQRRRKAAEARCDIAEGAEDNASPEMSRTVSIRSSPSSPSGALQDSACAPDEPDHRPGPGVEPCVESHANVQLAPSVAAAAQPQQNDLSSQWAAAAATGGGGDRSPLRGVSHLPRSPGGSSDEQQALPPLSGNEGETRSIRADHPHRNLSPSPGSNERVTAHKRTRGSSIRPDHPHSDVPSGPGSDERMTAHIGSKRRTERGSCDADADKENGLRPTGDVFQPAAATPENPGLGSTPPSSSRRLSGLSATESPPDKPLQVKLASDTPSSTRSMPTRRSIRQFGQPAEDSSSDVDIMSLEELPTICPPAERRSRRLSSVSQPVGQPVGQPACQTVGQPVGQRPAGDLPSTKRPKKRVRMLPTQTQHPCKTDATNPNPTRL